MVSVTIITRNRAEMLMACLESLVKQTRSPDEVVVVDNGSSDNTKEVILSFKKKLPIKYSQEKQVGIPYARNKGLKHASGTLILILDDDCIADKNWVENMIKAHRKYPKAWAIQGRTYGLPEERLFSLISEFKRFISLRRYSKNSPSLLKIKIFFLKNFNEELSYFTCDTRNFSIKKNILKKQKIYFDTDFYRGEDTDFGRQIVEKNGLIIFCPKINVFHWERSNLIDFLVQRWHFGRTAAKIADKWKRPSLLANLKFMLSPKIPIALLLFYKYSNQWKNLPSLTILLLLDRTFHLSGYFFEKWILLLSRMKRNSKIKKPIMLQIFLNKNIDKDGVS